MTSEISLQTTIDIAAIVSQQQREANAPGSLANRKELAAALQASYAAQGKTDVSPDMIEKAIDTYFNDRLQFKGIQGGALSRLAGAAYLQAFAHRKLLVGVLAGGAVSCAIYSPIQNGIQQARYESVVSEFTSLQKGIAGFNVKAPNDLMKYEEWLVDAKAKSTLISKAAYDNLLATYAAKLNDASDALKGIDKQVGRGIARPTVAEVADDFDGYREQNRSLKNAWLNERSNFDRLIQELNGIQTEVAGLAAVEKSYLQAIANPVVTEALADPDVSASKAAIEQFLVTGDASAAHSEVQKLNRLVEAKVKHQALVTKGKALTAQYADAFHYPESKAFAEALASQVSYAVNKDDGAGLAQIAKQYQALKAQETQAAMSLTIRVVNRNGVVSGTARVWDATGRKRFYLIMEAVDKAGMPQERLIYNQETGKTEAVAYWGQEVDEAVFRKVAADKQADGVVDDAVFGRKPAGTYSPIYERPVLKGTISRWPDKA